MSAASSQHPIILITPLDMMSFDFTGNEENLVTEQSTMAQFTTTTSTTTTTTSTPKKKSHKSPYWAHFHKYDPEVHPMKQGMASCNLCSKDININKGTSGMKTHLKSKHPEEYAGLANAESLGSNGNDLNPLLKQTTTTTKKKKKEQQQSKKANDIGNSTNEERRVHEKHVMEMWTLTRREINVVRQELKNVTMIVDNDDNNQNHRQELENDLRRLLKRKAEYAAELGFSD